MIRKGGSQSRADACCKLDQEWSGLQLGLDRAKPKQNPGGKNDFTNSGALIIVQIEKRNIGAFLFSKCASLSPSSSQCSFCKAL